MRFGTGLSWDAQAKTELCALLARLYVGELDTDLYSRLRAAGGPTLPWFEPALLELPEASALEVLAVEYCRLFIGPQALCPPYASAQRGEAMLGGRMRTRLETFMDAHGIPMPLEDWRIASPDHIAVELAILSYLYAEGFSDALIREFLGRHLLPWAPNFLANVESCTQYQLYQVAARLGAALLCEEESSAREEV